jgi:3-deoxy-D-manno-octulosonic acid kinase
MKHEIHKQGAWAITYDADLVETPGVEYFSVDYWRARQALSGEAVGRGSAWFIQAPFGPVVLRRFLRGGWAAVFSRESYFYTGVSASRSFREYRLLAELYAAGLPVPRPVAALCRHRGLLSTGAIMTVRITGAKPLVDLLEVDAPDANVWTVVGRSIRRFHDAGVWHADLNVRNILMDAGAQVFLIDFDRARYRPGTRVNGEGNLNRLKRSLLKHWPANEISALPVAWSALMAGYDE